MYAKGVLQGPLTSLPVYTQRQGKSMGLIRRTAERELSRRDSESGREEQDDKAKGRYLVAMRLGETPVLIPNTMVKT